MKDVRIPIEDAVLAYRLDGEVAYGEPVVMLDHDDDLFAGHARHAQGYAIVHLFSAEEHAALVERVAALFRESLAAIGHPWRADDRTLAEYHTRVDDAQHRALLAINGFRWPMERLPADRTRIERALSQFCGFAVTLDSPYVPEQVFQIRVVRPGKPDNNPPHRDVWLDRCRDALNLYIPLAGSSLQSSLPICPESHLWPESDIERTCEGASLNGVQFTVPAVTGSKRPLRLVRPQVAPGDCMVFSPYAVHGGGANFQSDATRFSLELRVWRASGPRRR